MNRNANGADRWAIGFLALGVIARLFVFIAGRSRGADAAGLPASPPLH